MPLAGKALKLAIFAEFRLPIQLRVFRARFGGKSPVVFRRTQTGEGHCVPKTLELRTTKRRPNLPGKRWEIVFENRVRNTRVPIRSQEKA